MIFIGQHHIMNQLKFILPDLYSNKNKGCNILLRGSSGFGKTTMALGICRYLAGSNFEVYLADWTKYRFNKRVIFIDEVHKITDFEKLFHEMDSGKHVFIFATNQDGSLPEAFSNRCYEYIFDEYSDEELILIARDSSHFSADDSQFLEIVKAGNNNPRIIKSLCSRISTYFRMNSNLDSRTTDFKELLIKIFSIEEGLDTLCKRYVETLEKTGGTASINTIKSLLHVDEATLKNNVEPVLFKKNMIKITSRGRSLVNNDSVL